ncbi:MAG: DM13 domain-containing protein [Candidatus Heimdallarchaeota archaeon]|nr:DM13 domain-containing protein [Candidatus Heimdallarchaeota archaeon]
MKRKIIIIALSVIILAGTGTGLGLYFWLNPLGGVNEQLEPGTVLSDGNFVAIDTSHWGTGKVQIVQLVNGSLQLQFDRVEIANGPDLYVYLSNKTSFTGIADSPGPYVDLGQLPYNEGRFSMSISGSTNLAEVNSVLIWCLAFTVVFTYASLS